jgi:hypothetical protein
MEVQEEEKKREIGKRPPRNHPSVCNVHGGET